MNILYHSFMVATDHMKFGGHLKYGYCDRENVFLVSYNLMFILI